MNPKYDMKEYTKFPKIKMTPWKNVFINWLHLVTENKGSSPYWFNNKNPAILSTKKNNAWRGISSLVFRWFERLGSIFLNETKDEDSSWLIQFYLKYFFIYLKVSWILFFNKVVVRLTKYWCQSGWSYRAANSVQI
jgi:hypothetical protein